MISVRITKVVGMWLILGIGMLRCLVIERERRLWLKPEGEGDFLTEQSVGGLPSPFRVSRPLAPETRRCRFTGCNAGDVSDYRKKTHSNQPACKVLSPVEVDIRRETPFRLVDL